MILIPKFAVLGNPVAHSKSPMIHTQFAQDTGIAMHYDRLNIANDTSFCHILPHLFGLDNHKTGTPPDTAEHHFPIHHGCNVTLPFKKLAHQLCHQHDAYAHYAGAVNTIAVKNAQLFGYNTDGLGFIADLGYHGIHLRGQNVAIIGAGGAAAGILPTILAQQPRAIHIINRTLMNAEKLCRQCQGMASDVPLYAHAWQNIAQVHLPKMDMLINTSSAGVYQDTQQGAVLLPAHVLHADTLAYDVSYVDNPFTVWAKAHDIRALQGMGMLIEQAAQAFFIWHGVMPDTKNIRRIIHAS